MNTRSSSYTGRAARSLESAFGPYARGPIAEPAQRMPLGRELRRGFLQSLPSSWLGRLLWGRCDVQLRV